MRKERKSEKVQEGVQRKKSCDRKRKTAGKKVSRKEEVRKK